MRQLASANINKQEYSKGVHDDELPKLVNKVNVVVHYLCQMVFHRRERESMDCDPSLSR